MTIYVSVVVDKHMLAFQLPNCPSLSLSESVSLCLSLSMSLHFSLSTKPPACLQTSKQSSIVIVSASYTSHFLFHYQEKHLLAFQLPNGPTASFCHVNQLHFQGARQIARPGCNKMFLQPFVRTQENTQGFHQLLS